MGSIFDRSLRPGIKETAAGILPARWSGRWNHYGLALLLVAAATTVCRALPEVLGSTPYVAFYLAWVGAAAFGGLGPGLLATAASWLCIDLLFDTTPWQTTFSDPATLGRLVFFLAGGTAVSLVAERMRRGRIFERRQASEVARAKQEWERTFDAVPDLISIMDRQYRILRVNRAMAERLGVPPERCIGLTCYQCVHDLDAPPALCPHTQCRADGRTHTAEVGEERAGYFLITCTPLFDPNGQWIGSVHVARDITARKRAEEDLKRSESILAQAGEMTHLGAWEIEFPPSGDIQQSRLRWSDEVYRIFGYAPHALAVSNDLFFQHVHPEDRQPVQEAVARAIAEQRPYQIEHRIVRSDGTERVVLEHAEIKFDEQGRPRQMIGAVQDITERRQADQALRESEERLRAIFDHAGVGLAEATDDDRLIAVNDRFCRILGYPRDELLGKTVHELTVPDDRTTSDTLNARLHEGQTDRIDYEKRYLQRDGTPVWVHATVSTIHDPDGRWYRSIATVEDISERKQAETALRELNATLETKVVQRTAELQQRARQLQRLTLELSETEDRERQRVAEILHDDLQQVLAAAKFHVSLMRNRVKGDSSLEATAAQIDQMLKDAIEKSRSLSHELSPAVLHHGELAETLRWLANQVRTKHGLAVRVGAHGQVRLPSEAIRRFLYKAAQELLFNVVKHARVQEARIRVRQCGRYICLSVSDRGHGFDPQGLREAAGFGLLTIRERVELLGGRMKIKSAVGQGSRFMIVVPAGEKPEDRGPKTDDGTKADEEAPLSVLGAPASSPALRVLLADDHAIVRQGLASLLSEADAVEIVGEATNGREAVNLADQLHPDVVIMDVSMPVMSGVEATRQIKKELPRTRIIALSMWEESEVREKMYRAGAEGYVLKTAPSEELLAAIRGQGPKAETAPSGR